jgi:hypothetical protein
MRPVETLYLRFRQLSYGVDMRCFDCVLDGGFFPNMSIFLEKNDAGVEQLVIRCTRCNKTLRVNADQFFRIFPFPEK